MQVVSGAFGHEKVHFEAPSASRLAQEMASFLAWFNAGAALDPFLLAGVAHLHFVTVHPFEDGNGRIARAISDLSLALADGCPDRFYSMSTQIYAERKSYYAELERAQGGQVDITAWLAWFLSCLLRAISAGEVAIGGVLRKARVWLGLRDRGVNQRQRVVLNRLLGDFQGFLTTAKYTKLAHCSADTAQRDIRELATWGALVQNDGGGRSTSYRIREP